MTDNTEQNKVKRARHLFDEYEEEIFENCVRIKECLFDYEDGISTQELIDEVFPHELMMQLSANERHELFEYFKQHAIDISVVNEVYKEVRRDLNRGFLYEFHHAILEADEN
jgi:hypothetical protein